MRLRDQPRRNYNVFNINESELNLPWEDREGIMLLQFNNSMGIEEHYINSIEAEWLFLMESLGWKAGLHEMGELEQTQPAAVMLGVEHMFLTEQMGWKKGLKLFKE